MNAFWTQLLASGFFLSACAESKDPVVQIPNSFLQTDHAPALRLLALEVTANFQGANIREAIEFIKGKCSDVDVGYKISIECSLNEPLPTITRQFKQVPLRTFFYLLSQDTGVTVEWVYENGLPAKIRIRRQ